MNYRSRKILEFIYHWLAPFFDPIQAVHSAAGIPRFIKDWMSYVCLSGPDAPALLDLYPKLNDWSVSTGIDAHYFYMSGWAMRRIIDAAPVRHVDVGSHNIFVNLLSAVVPVDFVDIRPLCADVPGLNCISGSVLSLPFQDESVLSLSCLHVAEHVGLGRYGDALDSNGTVKAANELVRVLKSGGDLFFAIPIGRPRVCFNAHRVVAPHQVLEMFASLELVEFSAVDDRGNFHRNGRIDEFSFCSYACGMFWFRKHGSQ